MVMSIGFLYLESHLPNVETLNNINLQVPLRIYSHDRQLIAEYGEKRRVPVSIKDIPEPLIKALLSTEDQRFYDHPGVDIYGLLRAGVQLVRTGEKSQGGSTITMQVARNFFLDRRKTFIRKINEILLAIEIDHKLPKDRILELYLNKIYLGYRAYGVAAAAEVYYGKTLQELSLAQMAMIAGLPKAPSSINPLANPTAALKRRNHVLDRMLEAGAINKQQHQQATREPLSATYHSRKVTVKAPYVAEMIRQAMVNRFGKEAYTHGYQVYTTIESASQSTANDVVKHNLLDYDQRHGYRGAEKHLGSPNNSDLHSWAKELANYPSIAELEPAIIVDVSATEARALQKNGDIIIIPWQGLQWARRQLNNGGVGPQPQAPADVVTPGDLVYTSPMSAKEWRLAQLPEVEAALVALQPGNGAIRALVGGFDFEKSHYNRVVQAQRQPGSCFKPFIYAAALAKGYTLASIINDAPVVISEHERDASWRPQNASRRFYGPTRLRVGLMRSRNLVSVRLLQEISIPYAISYVKRFGFDEEVLPKSLSLALGSLNVSPLEIARAYAVIANGGYRINPFLIERITDSNNNVILATNPATACDECQEHHADQASLKLAPRVMDQKVAYLITSALQDVIQHGTGRRARSLNRQDIAGKTGTTNDLHDAWFAGFNNRLVTVTWVGFDQPQSLHEYAAQTALPMWIDFMKTALQSTPDSVMAQPSGLVSVRIDAKTGLLATDSGDDTLFEIFRREKVPKDTAAAASSQPVSNEAGTDDDDDTEHLY